MCILVQEHTLSLEIFFFLNGDHFTMGKMLGGRGELPTAAAPALNLGQMEKLEEKSCVKILKWSFASKNCMVLGIFSFLYNFGKCRLGPWLVSHP